MYSPTGKLRKSGQQILVTGTSDIRVAGKDNEPIGNRIHETICGPGTCTFGGVIPDVVENRIGLRRVDMAQ
jgi:hypothetical protein